MVLPEKINYEIKVVMASYVYGLKGSYNAKTKNLVLENHDLKLSILFSNWFDVIVHEIGHFMDTVTIYKKIN